MIIGVLRIDVCKSYKQFDHMYIYDIYVYSGTSMCVYALVLFALIR